MVRGAAWRGLRRGAMRGANDFGEHGQLSRPGSLPWGGNRPFYFVMLFADLQTVKIRNVEIRLGRSPQSSPETGWPFSGGNRPLLFPMVRMSR